VVHNSSSQPGIEQADIGKEIKTVLFDTPNISAARNLGIENASGEIVAFIDDDAIAEPTWLERLVAPFSDPKIVATGGIVRGRNGFDLQWTGEVVDDFGRPTPIELEETTVVVPKANSYAKTHGTNCAFLRTTLLEFEGFDENFHFFLDETDLNIRIGKAGGIVALVPGAEVHHSYSASHHRTISRAPKSLHEVGASTSYFLKKNDLPDQIIGDLITAQRERLNRFVVGGQLEPRDVKELLSTLENGIAAGRIRSQKPRSIAAQRSSNFREFRPYSAPKTVKYVSCRRFPSRSKRRLATQIAASGDVATFMMFSWTAWRHRRRFHPDGYWLHLGGLFGKSYRDQKLFQFHSLKSRTTFETENLRTLRDPIN
jgi:cellulose synthase/poly-beta-1,6-N-acetylglucosamine synthase-like glycosyltransferase